MTASITRLIPRWYTVTVIAALTVFTAGMATIAAFADDVVGHSMWGLAAAAGLVLVAAVSALARPRRPRDPDVTAEGVRVFRAPVFTVWPLVAAWVALLLTAAAWGYVALTDFGALEAPGASLITVGGALASLPAFARLVTGRLHRWTLELGPDALTYRGYQTDVTVPWSQIRRARIQQRGPAGIRVDVRGAGRGGGEAAGVVVPVAAFDVPVEQLLAEIERARSAGRTS